MTFLLQGVPPDPSPKKEGNPDRIGVAFFFVSFQSIGDGLTAAFGRVSFADG
jgi:hypothetical protein